MGAIIVPNNLPTTLVALSEELANKRDCLALQADQAVITDIPSLLKAEETYTAIKTFASQVHEGRMAITRKIDALKKQFIEAEEQATGTLEERSKKLGKMIADFRADLKRKQDEADRKAREEAEARAAEQRRLAEEARKEELAKYEKEKEEARQVAEEEAKIFGTPIKPVEIAPPPAKPLPIIPVIEEPKAIAPALPKSAVRTTTRKKAVIFDSNLLIAEACKGGGKLFGRQVLIIDTKAVEEMAVKGGVIPPGVRIDTVEGIASAGNRHAY